MTAAPRDISSRPYADSAADYWLAGWRGIIHVPPDRKFPPPKGFTGDDGRDTAIEDLIGFTGSHPADSVALRMPHGMIGIDVDDYAKGGKVKTGAKTLAAKAAEWGPLPPTWSSTARGPGQPARISFYRVPAQRYAGTIDPDIEIIQRHHRYAVVWPSPHYETGAAYAWYDPDGNPVPPGVIPRPEDMPELPPAWVKGLAEGASHPAGANAPLEAGQQLLLELEGGEAAEAPWCRDVAAAMDEARRMLRAAEPGSRHDAMLRYTLQAVMLGAKGHPGYLTAIRALDELWNDLTAGEGRQAEFAEMVTGAARSAVTEHGPAPAGWDPCLLLNEAAYQAYKAPAPGVPDRTPEGEDWPEPEPIEPERYWTPYQVIGTAPFETQAELDSVLARDVLARAWPALRYAPDAGTWLVRGPDTWVPRKGNAAAWAVDLVSWLMLPGDPEADQDTAEFRQAKRRARFCTAAASAGIATKMNAQVAVGFHPSTTDLAGLDSDREILWAGGIPFDLRASLTGPEAAQRTDWGMPHLHSAGVVPERRDTPLWNAFLAAVWPDEEMRAWALRVLAIAVTGYSDKALPIMLGATDRGKTSVIDLMMSVLGSYAHTADARLLSPADRSHASIVFALKGRRLSFIDEAPRAGTMAQERLKQITGGADLTANRMNENPVTFSPTHTLILTANPEHEPNLVDAAIRRRVRLIPCDGDPAAVVAARAAIGNLSGPRWRAEAPGVLAALMAEAAAWLADPRSADSAAAPEAGQQAALEIQEAQDFTLNWVREECEYWQSGTKSHQLFEAFTESCKKKNIHPSQIPSEKAWALRLKDLGYELPRRHDGTYKALRVRPPGTFVPTPAEFMGTSGGSTRPSAGSGGLSAGSVQGQSTVSQPSTNGGAPGQTLHNPTSVQGVQGPSLSLTHAQAGAHAHTWDTNAGFTPTQPAQPAPSPEAPAEPAQPLPGTPDGPAESSQPVTKTRARKTPERKPGERKPREPKAPKVKVADPELTGPVLSLPALVTRDGRVLCCTPADAEMAVTLAGTDLTVDVEHTGYPPGHPDYRLRTVQLGSSGLAAVFAADDPAQREAVSRLVSAAQVLRAHSAMADLVPLDLDGLAPAAETWPKMNDTVLTAKLADPAMSGSDEAGLKELARDVLREAAVSPDADKRRAKVFSSGGWLGEPDALTPVARNGWAQVNTTWESQIIYAASDVLDTAAVAQRLPAADPRVYERERTAQRMCARVAHRGLRLDPDRVRELASRETGLREEARAKITPYGIENPGSAQQVAAAFTGLGVPLPRTKPSAKFPAGQPSVAEAVLSRISVSGAPEASQLARDILDYRDHATILSLTLEPFRVLCEHGDGRTRPVVYTLAADTGRMSCRRPNLQQIKREGGYRSCITADPGYLLVSADFASVEVRTAAALSGDPGLTEMIAMGDAHPDRKTEFDLHWRVVRMVHGPDATKSQRYPIKRAVFGHIYGGAAEAMAAGARIPLEDAERVKAAIAALAPRLTQWDQEMRKYVRNGGREFPAYSGRTIWLDRFAHKAVNYAVQGTAREFLVDALIRWESTPWGDCTVLPVHDELIAMVPESDAEPATRALVECMQSALYGVTIAAEASAPSFAWQDAS
jgi:P4 family phage/plasmid primase-like protien